MAPQFDTVDARNGTIWGKSFAGVEVRRCVTDRNGYHAGAKLSGAIIVRAALW